mmetsp:Transcript_110848/g.357639  ORF Transcript_110848/g.357639 Transcript_110848/m.357639 type:complete len:151 (-) Transcript_110848:68-520(-)
MKSGAESSGAAQRGELQQELHTARLVAPHFLETPLKSKLLSVAELLCLWNVLVPAGTCCVRHALWRDLQMIVDRMARIECASEIMFFEAQCQTCKLMCEGQCDWCGEHSKTKSTSSVKTRLPSVSEVPDKDEDSDCCPAAAVIGAARVHL